MTYTVSGTMGYGSHHVGSPSGWMSTSDYNEACSHTSSSSPSPPSTTVKSTSSLPSTTVKSTPSSKIYQQPRIVKDRRGRKRVILIAFGNYYLATPSKHHVSGDDCVPLGKVSEFTQEEIENHYLHTLANEKKAKKMMK